MTTCSSGSAPVQQAFSVINFGAAWDQFRGPLDRAPQAILALKIAADMISRQFAQPALEQDVLSDIAKQVDEVRSEVLGRHRSRT